MSFLSGLNSAKKRFSGLIGANESVGICAMHYSNNSVQKKFKFRINLNSGCSQHLVFHEVFGNLNRISSSTLAQVIAHNPKV